MQFGDIPEYRVIANLIFAKAILSSVFACGRYECRLIELVVLYIDRLSIINPNAVSDVIF